MEILNRGWTMEDGKAHKNQCERVILYWPFADEIVDGDISHHKLAGIMSKQSIIVSQKQIENAVLLLRGEKVLLDADLADMYGVSTKVLNQSVKRNLSRFPSDFMFRLTSDETDGLNRSQIVTGSQKHRDPRYPPFAFTEQGVAMLSSVLRSERAVRVNIAIMRAFVRLRQILAVNSELAIRLDELERRVGKHDEKFVHVISAIRQLMEPPITTPKRRRIGFHVTQEESSTEATRQRLQRK